MADQKSSCVLVVEDHEDTLHAMVRLLSIYGFSVRAASSFEEAEKLAEGCDIVVSDIGLGEHSGYDLMRDLKGRYGVKGVAVTGYSSSNDIRNAGAAGFDRFVGKPVQIEKLVAVINELRV